MTARDALLDRFQTENLSGKTLNELLRFLSLPFRERTRLSALLDELVASGKLFETSDGRFGTKEGLGLIEGTISGHEKGFAFFLPSDREKYPNDLFLPPHGVNGALHKDTVLVERIQSVAEHDEACVVAILARGYTELVGTFYKDRRAGYVYPDEKRFSQTLYVPLRNCRNVKSGVKVVAEITDYPFKKAPEGKITEILGDETDFFAEERSIVRAHGLKENFSVAAEEAAEKINANGIEDAELLRRKDFRDKVVFTIDGDDTKDLDDAVSVEKTNDGYLLGVHIADVSHYVSPRSVLDEEAFERGTSVYFPDRVLPMLPKALSNGICSLNEGEDRLTLSCMMHIDKYGNVNEFEIVKSVIRSVKQATYEVSQAVLDGDADATERYAAIAKELFLCAELAEILKAKRKKNGCVAPDVKEINVRLDEHGEIILSDKKRPFTGEIIEQFMLEANETTARFARSLSVPYVYRVHDKPTEEKAKSLRAFAQGLGINVSWNDADVKPKDFANILQAASNLSAFPVLNRVLLRSMQKARYAATNSGHFGLASDCYCHFTSPIRRYPDLCVHRILKESIDEKSCERYAEFVEIAAKKASECERVAIDTERETDALYVASYMSERIGKTFDAIISGVSAFGLFAELENGAEGFIPIETLRDSFEYVPERYLLKGATKSFSLGQRIRVRVEDVDFYERRTYFSLTEA